MVNHNNIFKKIGYILNELQDQYQFLSENPEQLSELELELFLANANFLTDHIQIVKKLGVNQPIKELPEASTPAELPEVNFQEHTPSTYTPTLVVEEPEQEEKLAANDTATFEFVLKDREPEETIDLEDVIEDNHHEEQVDYDEQEAENVEEYDNEVTYVAPAIDEVGPEPFLVYNEVEHAEIIKNPEPVVHYQEPPPVLIEDDIKSQEIPLPTHNLTPDKVEEKVVQPSSTAPRPTLNDLLAASTQKANNFNQENSSQSVTDLKKAVNLNEKLLYIKDLFNGYNLAYSEAIDIINKLPDFRSADNFLQNNYAIKNNWQAKQATVDKFYALLKQRFNEA